MIRSLNEEECVIANEVIHNDVFQNPYICIDVESFGFEVPEKIKTRVLASNEKIKAILYQYNCIQRIEREARPL